MSLTFTIVKRFKPLDGIRRGIVDITFDATYIATGWPVTPADLRLNGLAQIDLPATVNETGIMIGWDYGSSPLAGGKILAKAGVGGADVSNQLSAVVVRGEYIGV